MTTARAPQLSDIRRAPTYRISAGDSVKLCVLRHPESAQDHAVFLEIWEPGGTQPPNSHPSSVETFLVLAGEGTAYSDEHVVPIVPGQLLVLSPGSVHRIVNTGTGRLYAVTTMVPDAGFAGLVCSGVPATLEPEDLSVLGWGDESGASIPAR